MAPRETMGHGVDRPRPGRPVPDSDRVGRTRRGPGAAAGILAPRPRLHQRGAGPRRQGRCGDPGRDRRARGRGEAGAGRAADVGDGQAGHAAQRRSARLHEPGAVLVAGSIQAGRPALHPQGRRAQPGDQPDHGSRQPRTAGWRGDDALPRLCLHGTRGLRDACRPARARVVPRARDADEPASPVRSVHPRHQQGPRHRHHRNAQPAGVARRRPPPLRHRPGRRPTKRGCRPGCARI